MRTKAASKMVIRRRLSTIKKLAAEYELCIDVIVMTSNCNLANGLTRVPQKWYKSMKKGDELAQPVCATSMEEPDEIVKIHHLSGHPGVQKMCYFVRLTNPLVSTSAERDVVKRCQTCQSINPASVKYITHYGSQHFLMLIDCGPSRFAVWQPLVCQDSTSIIHQLESVFYERGPPGDILTDNSKFKKELATYVISEQFVSVNGTQCHVKDLRPALETTLSVSDSK